MKTVDELGISPMPWSVKGSRVSRDMWYSPIGETVKVGVCECMRGGENDARLIAAAPELYRELYDCRRFLRFLLTTNQKWLDERVTKRLDLVEKALAKAGGEEEGAK